MNSDFFTAKEDPEKYDDVCDISSKKNRKNTNVLTSFSSLQCPGTELHEWESHKPLYMRKFKKAKQCVQRRITKMKDFSARTNANKTSRKRHIYPIQVAYAYGKDCLKKFGSNKEQQIFKESVDSLINKISESKPDIKTYFGNSIENVIHSRSNKNAIKEILDKKYYNSLQSNIINKERNIGYNRLNNDDKDKFFSIYDEGFSRNLRYSESENNLNESENNLNEIIRPSSKTLKKNFKHRRNTKKKTNIIHSNNFNIKDLNTFLQTNKYKITDKHIRDEITKRIDELTKLFRERIIIDEKLYFIEDIYNETFSRHNKVNINVSNIIGKLSGRTITRKVAKQAGLTEKNLHKYDAFDKRQKLGNDLSRLHKNLLQRLDKLNNNIMIILSKGDKEITKPLEIFFITQLPNYLLKIIDQELSLLSSSQKDKLLSEKNKLFSLVDIIKTINKELYETEVELTNNITKQTKLEQMIKVPALAELSKEKLHKLKQEEIDLQEEIIKKYKEKTNKIRIMEEELSKNIDNLYILKDRIKSIPNLSSLIKINNSRTANV